MKFLKRYLHNLYKENENLYSGIIFFTSLALLFCCVFSLCSILYGKFIPNAHLNHWFYNGASGFPILWTGSMIIYLISKLARKIYKHFNKIYKQTMQEKEYKSTVYARDRGALGIFSPYSEYVWAENAEKAEEKITNKYTKKFEIERVEITE